MERTNTILLFCAYLSLAGTVQLPSPSDLRFLWLWGTLPSIIWTPLSLVGIKRCSEQPTAFCRTDNAVTVSHWLTSYVVLSYSVPISVPCLSRRLILLFRRQMLRFLRNVGQSLPGYTSLHDRGRCCSLLSLSPWHGQIKGTGNECGRK